MEDKLFHLKGSVAAYIKIKYTNQVTSNNGEIDLKAVTVVVVGLWSMLSLAAVVKICFLK